MPWYIYAIGAAIFWGLHYPLIENALKTFTVPTTMFVVGLASVAFGLFNYSSIVNDFKIFLDSPINVKLNLFIIGVTFAIGAYLVNTSIGDKNATAASFIEISYPIFVAIFSVAIVGGSHMNLPMAIGALLIFSGVFVISYFA